MEITSTREMLNYRNSLFKELRKNKIKLERINTSPFTNLKEKRIINETLSEIRYNLDQIQEIMFANSKFKSHEFYEFLKQFLSLAEDNYELYVLKIADSYPQETLIEKIKRERAWKKGKRLDEVPGNWCYFISDIATKEFVEENIFDDYDLEEFMENKPKDTIVIDSFYTQFFNRDLTMKEEFRNHPKLKTAIYELIDLKIKQSELTNEERFQIVLQNTVRRNINRGYQKKKESK